MTSPRTWRHLHCRHSPENNSLPARDAFGIYLWVEDGARVRDHRREKRGFARVQVRRRLVEIVLRRGFHAINSIAPFNHIQIEFEDATLREIAFHEVSDDCFLAFA